MHAKIRSMVPPQPQVAVASYVEELQGKNLEYSHHVMGLVLARLAVQEHFAVEPANMVAVVHLIAEVAFVVVAHSAGEDIAVESP